MLSIVGIYGCAKALVLFFEPGAVARSDAAPLVCGWLRVLSSHSAKHSFVEIWS